MKEIIEAIRNFKIDRPIMDADNTDERYKELLKDEVDELMEANTRQELEEEYADVIIYALNALLHLDIDPVDAIMTKIAYNHVQHPANMYQMGDFETQRKASKDLAKEISVKTTIYEAE